MDHELEQEGASSRRNFVKGAAGIAAATAVATAAVMSTSQVASAAVGLRCSIEGIGGFDILAFSWGASSSQTVAGGGAGTGKVNVQDVSLTKFIDGTSPDLFTYLVSGRIAPSARIVVTQGTDKIRYDVRQVFVTSISNGGSGGEDRLTENISLGFAELTFAFNGKSGMWSAV